MNQVNTRFPADSAESDFKKIEAAVKETARGRRFLAEYVRRNRSLNAKMLTDAVRKLELAVHGQQTSEELERLRDELKEIATDIAEIRRDLASMSANKNGRFGAPGDGLEMKAMVAMTEKATSDILGAVNQIRTITQALSKGSVTIEPCEERDTQDNDGCTPHSLQDLVGQRIAEVIAALDNTERRIERVIDIWRFDDTQVKPSGASESSETTAERKLEETCSRHESERFSSCKTAVSLAKVSEAEPNPQAEPEPKTESAPQSEDTVTARPAEALPESPEMNVEENQRLLRRLARDIEAAVLPRNPGQVDAPESEAKRGDQPLAEAATTIDSTPMHRLGVAEEGLNAYTIASAEQQSESKLDSISSTTSELHSGICPEIDEFNELSSRRAGSLLHAFSDSSDVGSVLEAITREVSERNGALASRVREICHEVSQSQADISSQKKEIKDLSERMQEFGSSEVLCRAPSSSWLVCPIALHETD